MSKRGLDELVPCRFSSKFARVSRKRGFTLRRKVESEVFGVLLLLGSGGACRPVDVGPLVAGSKQTTKAWRVEGEFTPSDLFDAYPVFPLGEGRGLVVTQWREGGREVARIRGDAMHGKAYGEWRLNGPGARHHFDLSSDGSAMVYADRDPQRRGIWHLDLDQGVERRIFAAGEGTGVRDPRWTRQGGLTWVAPQGDAATLWALSKLDAEPRRIASGEVFLAAALAPDARRVAFFAEQSDGLVLHVLDLQTNQRQTLGTSVRTGWDRRVCWSADGESLFLAAARGEDPRLRAWQVEVDSGRWQSFESIANEVLAVFCLADERLALSTYRVQLRIATVPSEGGDLTPLLLDDAVDAFLPSWHPDGRSLAFVRGPWLRTLFPWNLDLAWVERGPDGHARSSPVELVATPSEDYGVAYSPDGRWLAYHSHESDTDDLFLRPATSDGAALRITAFGSGADAGEPSFSADGRQIVSSARGGLWLVTIDPMSGAPVGPPRALPLHGFEGEALSPRFSPDGRSIVFVGHLSPRRQGLFAVAAGGGEVDVVRMWEGPHVYGGVAFHPDGQTLFHAFPDENGIYQLEQLDLTTRATRRLTNSPMHVIQPSISPDGSLLAVTLLELSIDAWIGSEDLVSGK